MTKIIFKTLKKYCLIALLGGALSLTVSQASFANFVEDIVDLPLMEGLTPIEGAGFVFEQENGRIIEKMAIGSMGADAIHHFYKETLPQLGWVEKDGRFYREKEELNLTFRKEGEFTVITFHLSPQN